MGTLGAKIDILIDSLENRLKLEEQAEQLRKLGDSFLDMNNRIERTFFATALVVRIADSETIREHAQKLKEQYTNLKSSLQKLWSTGEQTDVDLREPEEFMKAMDNVVKGCSEVDQSISLNMQEKRKEFESSRGMAESMALIPDLKINVERFNEIISFIENIGLTVEKLAQRTGFEVEKIENLVDKWHDLIEQVDQEIEKLSFDKLKDSRKLSPQCVLFLELFVNRKGTTRFRELTPEIVREIQEKLPELADRLQLSIT